MANSVETVWKLILDEKEARAGESMIQRLARLIKDKLGGESVKAIDKTTEAIKDQTEALKENEKAAKDSGERLSASEGISKGLGGASRTAGVGSLLGAGEGLSLLGDTADAIEGLSELSGVIGKLGVSGGLAVVAIAVLSLAVADFAKAAQEQADKLNEFFDAQREVFDEIAGGATTADLQEQIDLLQTRRELEKITLQDATEAYANYEQQIRDTFGVFGELILGILRIIDPREEALSSQKDESQKRIDESISKEKQYQDAIEKGLTAKNDAAAAEEELSKARDEAERKAKQEAEKAQREQEAAAKKAQAEAEQFAKQMEAIEKQRYNAAQKYGDALVDIARKSADDAIKAAKALREKQVDNQRGFNQDIADMTEDFHASEREEQIKRQDEDANILHQHALKLASIRDSALADETDLLRKRNFLDANRVRERANAEIEQENKALIDSTEEKRRAQKQEDAQQLRELDKARRERFTALQRANEDAKIAYQRDIANQRDARKIAEREAKIARDRELRAANEAARALLGIKQQQAQSELNIASQVLAGIRAMGNSTTINNNNSRTNYGNVSVPVYSNNPAQVQQQVLQVLGKVGLV